MRETLEVNKKYILNSNENKKIFYIKSIIGMGATFIVYEAYYLDDMDLRHNVRLKEYCPIELCEKNRDENKFVVWKCNTDIGKAISSFEKIYRTHLLMQSKYDFVNVTSKIVDCIYEGNGTKYIVMECENGESFEKVKNLSLYSKLKILRALSNTIEKYHNIGWLHLDLKPENFMIIPETTELVKLFDFDSMISIDALQEDRIKKISYSNYWAAPEVKQGKFKNISYTSDIYSLGAIFYYMLFDEIPDLKNRLKNRDYDFSNLSILNDINPGIKSKIVLFLKKTIESRPEKRYQRISELLQDLNEMIHMANPTTMYLCSNFPVQSSCFLGREKELEKAKYILDTERFLIITGIGGIGKTEFSQYYAKEYKKNYSCIIWAKIETTVEHAILDDSIFNIVGYDSKKNSVEEKIRMLKSVVDENTLIILDNVKDYEEHSLKKLLQMPCRFLITSRKLSDNYFTIANQINLGCMDTEILVDIFKYYYRKYICLEEKNQIIKIIEYIGNYTLLVPIIAKQMHLSNITPKEMQDRIQKSFLTMEFPEKVKHQKDFEIYEGGILEHVENIFTWTEFTDEELLALKVLALMRNITVSRTSMAALCGFSLNNNETTGNIFERLFRNLDLSCINTLIEKGMLTYNEEIDCIEMHDVIATVINNKFEKQIDNYGMFKKNINNICKGINEWVDEYVDDFFYYYSDVSEYQIDRYIDLVMEVLRSLDYGIKENSEYVIDTLDEIGRFQFMESLEILDKIKRKHVYSKEYEVLLNMLSARFLIKKIRYCFIKNLDKKEIVEECYDRITQTICFVRKYYKENKEEYIQCCVTICREFACMLVDYYSVYFDIDKSKKIYKKILYILRSIKKESKNEIVIKEIIDIREIIVTEHQTHFRKKLENDKYFETKREEPEDLYEYYQQQLDEEEHKIWILEKVLLDPEISEADKDLIFEDIVISFRYFYLNNICNSSKKIENAKSYCSPEEYFYQRLMLKLYNNGVYKNVLSRNTIESIYEGILYECALRGEYKALFTYLPKLIDILKQKICRREYFDMFMDMSVFQITGSLIIFKRLNLDMIINQIYGELVDVIFTRERVREIKNLSFGNRRQDTRYAEFLDDAAECAKKCGDLDSYGKYKRLVKELLHIDFACERIDKKFKKNVLNRWNYYVSKISSSEPFDNLQELIIEVQNDKILNARSKEILISCLSKPYNWQDILSDPIVLTKGYMLDEDNLEELIAIYKMGNFSNLLDKINIVAGICYMSFASDKNEICDFYMDKYKKLLMEIPISGTKMLSLLKYEFLPQLFLKTGEENRANELYFHMFHLLLNKEWRDFSYNEYNITREIYDNMFKCILSKSNKEKYGMYKEIQENYILKGKELEIQDMK